jgi:hypothetical protein
MQEKLRSRKGEKTEGEGLVGGGCIKDQKDLKAEKDGTTVLFIL